MNSIGFKIKKLREHKNLSQEDLAFRLDTTQSNLSKIENGQIDKINFMLMQKVCKIFDIKPDYFLRG
ncbi:helix-turn-helix domain-containing protein [Chryseobacterium taklimakanense]|uniref:helix-turn-helix domain-containing protein n=1 Tax=Chryseobacterium taklimakanense TaxID=536441 RepID=UPI001EF4CB1D|nr:helix-turn-helix transcriptional regulator [Chryseobacterium taklimakanense]MCG7281148.1 helix-turn-helix domain-containing protein [Chryseobacterium taklimakanense]